MKIDVNKYEDYQMYVLNDGRVAVIKGVQPMNRIHKTESERICYVYFGTAYDKSKQFSNPDSITFENDIIKSAVTIDCSKYHEMTLAAFRQKEVAYLGKLTDDAVSKFDRMI